MPPPEDTPRTAVVETARWLTRLAPGPLAELRRMDAGRAAPVFWRLAARYPATVGRREETWIHIVAVLALLTPKGNPTHAEKPPLHNCERPLGTVFCDGGDPTWPDTRQGNPRPVLSELRLAKLLASRGAQRPTLLRRAARSLARSMQPGSGINVVDVAYALLQPENTAAIARTYYTRFDAATRAAQRSDSSQGHSQ